MKPAVKIQTHGHGQTTDPEKLLFTHNHQLTCLMISSDILIMTSDGSQWTLQ